MTSSPDDHEPAAPSTSWLEHLSRVRTPLQASADAGAWMVAIAVATWLRYEMAVPAGARQGILVMAVVAALVHATSGFTMGLYMRRWRYGQIDEVPAVLKATAITAVLVIALNRVALGHAIPTSASMAAGVGALVLMGGVRFVWLGATSPSRRSGSSTGTRLLIFGAGEAGQHLVTQMLADPSSTYAPVGFLDDDRSKANLSIRRVPVVGTRHDLAEVVERLDATMLIIAAPSAGPSLVRAVYDDALAAGLVVRVLPSIDELIDGASLSQVRPVSDGDILGRGHIDTDLDSIAHYLTGKRVLVTGAGGSIGSELCRQVHRFAPDRLIMLDRDESGLHGVQMSIEGRALLDNPDLVVADLRDPERMAEVFAEVKPHVVFHAAALKHLPLLEMHPAEGVKTNVWGTQTLLDLAAQHGVERFVNISTDKAADPTSVLGYTKRIAERLAARAAERSEGVVLSVRFGNVLGSRGSMLTAFRSQIEAGGPVTVTDRDVTRYFMTIGEAVQLVIQAGAIGRDGEALVLDMGEPVRIDDVARRLIAESGKRVGVVYTGLRPGEKLHEVLLATDETDDRPCHPLISHVSVPGLDPSEAHDVLGGRGDELLSAMRGLCTEPTQAESEVARSS